MSDQYLWDGSGKPDPDVERLEQMLGRLRAPESTWRPASAAPQASWRLRSLAPTLAAAASIALMLGLTWRSIGNTPSWDVARLDGRPRIGSTTLAGNGRIAVGQTLVTDS